MATKIQINVDLSQIPESAKRKIQKQSGAIAEYVNLDIVLLREPDDRGNTYSVSLYCDGTRTYVGRGKNETFGEGAKSAASAPKFKSSDLTPQDDDLPFGN